MKRLISVLSLSVLGIVAAEYVFAEDYTNRPTQVEQDETVAQATECGNAVSERDLAVNWSKTNLPYCGLKQPYFVSLQQDLEVLAPNYVDTGSVNVAANDYTNARLWTISNLCQSAGVGDGTNLFTPAPQDLQECYKVLFNLRYTMPMPSRPGGAKWTGTGKGLTAADAYGAACGDYHWVSNGYSASEPLEQSCQMIYWSNYIYATCGSNEVIQTNIYLYVRLTNEYLTGTNIVVVSSNNYRLYTTNTWIVATNLIVTGTINPDVTGIYSNEGTMNGYPIWKDMSGEVWIHCIGGSTYTIERQDPNYCAWWRYLSTDPIGDYSPVISCEGNPHAEYSYVTETNVIEGPEVPANCSGTYSNAGNYNDHSWWVCAANGYNIYYTNAVDGWVIDTTLTLDTNAAFLWKTGEPVGIYNASNFHSATTAGYEYVYSAGPDCSGDYEEVLDWWPLPVWKGYTFLNPYGEPIGWYDWFSNGVWYISQNVGVSAPAWRLSDATGTNPAGEYSSSGQTGIYNTVIATWATNYVETWVPIYDTNIWNGASNFFECALLKSVCTNDAYASTNIEHSVLAYLACSTLPSVEVPQYLWAVPGYPSGTAYYWWWRGEYWVIWYPNNDFCSAEPLVWNNYANYFDDQGFGLVYNGWSLAGNSTWTFAPNNPSLFGGNVSTPPNITPDVGIIPNSVISSGFVIQDWKAIMDWKFLYATEPFW